MKQILKLSFFTLILLISLIKISGCKKDNNTKDITPPAEVTNLKSTIGAYKITLTWKDPTDKDLSKINIIYDNTTLEVEKGIQLKEINNLVSGKDYSFTIKTVDELGNKSSGQEIKCKIDYRMQYVGAFTFLSYRWWTSPGQTTFSDTMIFIGSITISENTDSLIQIRYRSGGQTQICGTDSVYGAHIEPHVDAKGVMNYERVLHCSNQSYFQGQFISIDSVNISIGSGGYGAQWGQIVKGKRVK